MNETVNALFDNESLMKVYQSVNIPNEAGQNMDDFDSRLKQKQEELKRVYFLLDGLSNNFQVKEE
ncbi:MAG: hypothetical protein J6U73_04710 [Alistipes sp.]|nr:hypothetical protein [Alistipes sp.]